MEAPILQRAEELYWPPVSSAAVRAKIPSMGDRKVRGTFVGRAPTRPSEGGQGIAPGRAEKATEGGPGGPREEKTRMPLGEEGARPGGLREEKTQIARMPLGGERTRAGAPTEERTAVWDFAQDGLRAASCPCRAGPARAPAAYTRPEAHHPPPPSPAARPLRSS